MCELMPQMFIVDKKCFFKQSYGSLVRISIKHKKNSFKIKTVNRNELLK